MEIKPTMMNARFIILVAIFAAALSLFTRAEVKQPDTYAYTRGVEAYNEDKYDGIYSRRNHQNNFIWKQSSRF